MTTREPKDNSGALFKNNRKEAETHADYNGSVRIEGHDYWINAWLKEGQSGKFFSLSFKRKDGTAARPESPPSPVVSRSLDDEIPF